MFLIKTNFVKNRWLYVAIWNIGKCVIKHKVWYDWNFFLLPHPRRQNFWGNFLGGLFIPTVLLEAVPPPAPPPPIFWCLLRPCSQEIFVLILQEIFVILYTGMSYNLLVVYKSVLQVESILQLSCAEIDVNIMVLSWKQCSCDVIIERVLKLKRKWKIL